MRLLTASLSTGLILTFAFSSASAQGANEAREKGRDTAQSTTTPQSTDAEIKTAPAPITPQDKPSIQIFLIGGGRMQVDELTERSDGFWYKRGNVMTFLDKNRVERIARLEDIQADASVESLEGNWNISDSAKVENFFILRFNRRLPLTAFGQSELHTRWGLDHRQGIDVGVECQDIGNK